MGFGRNVIGVLFWYGVLGGSGAFLYRLIAELARTWSPSRATFQPFGFTAVRILALLDWLPLRLFSLLIILGKQAGTISKRYSNKAAAGHCRDRLATVCSWQ